MNIYNIEQNDEKAWNHYVLNSNNSTFYHQICWKNIIEEVYGHKSFYLVAEEHGEIIGIFPLSFINSRIFGKQLISIPFSPYGGPCANNEFIEQELIDESKRLTVQLSAKNLEIRSNPNKEIVYKGLMNKSTKVSSILELNEDPNIVLMEKLKRNKRKTIYKSQKMGLTWNWTCDTDDFYKLFSLNMRELGSPAHSKKFFKMIIDKFPNSARVLLVKKENVVIYSAFYLLFKMTIINSWSSTLKKYREYFPTDFGIWNAIQYGCENGYKYYDFGRSQKESANFEFKRRWGSEAKELNYQYYLNISKNIPNTTSSNPKREMFGKFWSKTPLFITDALGSLIRKNVP